MAEPLELERPGKIQYHARKNHHKTRTGCFVCKIRRVKCDEAKPACKRCTATGRKCEGYPTIPPRNESPLPQALASRPPGAPSPQHLSLSSDIPGDYAERRSFYYLRQRAAYDISGYFESDFWDRLVLQISHTEPTVRHALVAMGALCETSELQQASSGLRVQYALQQYNKAVRMLTSYLAAQQSQLDVVLTSCLVFIWLEFMWDNFPAGMRHLQGGLKILRDFKQSKSPAFASQHVDVSLIHLFARLKNQAIVYGMGNEVTEESENQVENYQVVPNSFSTVERARDSLHTSLDSAFRFARQVHDSKLFDQPEPWEVPLPLQATLDSHVDRIQRWHEALNNSPAWTSDSLDTRRNAAVSLLRVYGNMVLILLETLFTRTQMVYDQYDDAFRRMLPLAEQLVVSQQRMGNIISFDMGIMAPLFFVVLKCRNLPLRRKALELLKLSPHREGVWNRQDVVDMGEWKINIEERGRGGIPETEPLPEEARTADERLYQLVNDRRRKTMISFQRRVNGAIEFGEEATDLSMRMAQLI